MKNTNQTIIIGKQILSKNEIDEREARLLLAYVMGINHQELIKYTEIEDEIYAKFLVVLEKRCQGIPYAYIVGHKEFMKLDFIVNSNVLIPREDTEILVQKIIDISKTINKEKIKILDLCTGSGCIAISLAKYIENAQVTGADISSEALNIAKENAKINDVKVTFVKSDIFGSIDGKFDIIVSNPPYIKTKVINDLQKEVKENEPFIALDGGEDGRSFYKNIIDNAKKYLVDDGVIAFEIGYDQRVEVEKLLAEGMYKNIESFKDYSGNDRVVIAYGG